MAPRTSLVSSLLVLAIVSACSGTRSGTTPVDRDESASVLLERVAGGRAELASLVDPEAGLLIVRSGLGGESDGPREFSARRVCGDALDEPLRELAAHLARTIALGDHALVCETNRCVDPLAMELDAERVYRFESVEGRLRLVSVTLLDVLAPEPVVASYRAWAGTAEIGLASAACGESFRPTL
jgi:hypothetical protein